MVFMIIEIVMAVIAVVLFGVVNYHKGWRLDWATLGSAISGAIACMLMLILICAGIDAKENKSLMKAHLENPSNFTYSQLAEHNEFVTKSKVWQGTIFSFYNDVELQTIDIDNVSQKVTIDSKEKK